MARILGHTFYPRSLDTKLQQIFTLIQSLVYLLGVQKSTKDKSKVLTIVVPTNDLLEGTPLIIQADK